MFESSLVQVFKLFQELGLFWEFHKIRESASLGVLRLLLMD